MSRPLANGCSTGGSPADRVVKKRDENGFVVDQILPSEEEQQRLRQQKKEDQPVIDAGLKSLDHCTCAIRSRSCFSFFSGCDSRRSYYRCSR